MGVSKLWIGGGGAIICVFRLGVLGGHVRFLRKGVGSFHRVGSGSAKMRMSRNVFIEEVKKLTFVKFQQPWRC